MTAHGTGTRIRSRGRRREPARALTAWEALPAWAHAAAGAVVLLAVWWAFAAAHTARGAVPAPDRVLARCLDNLSDATYWHSVSRTVSEAAQGYLWGNVLALALAAAVILAPWLDGPITQFGVIISCVPLTAVAPLIVLMSATSSRLVSAALAAMLVFFTTLTGALVGLRAADPAALDVVGVYGGGRWKQLAKVRVMAAVPDVLNALKLAAPAAFVGAILGEFFLSGVDSGLGIMLMAAQVHSRPEPLWALALLSAAVAGAAYGAVGLLERVVAPWATGAARPGERGAR